MKKKLILKFEQCAEQTQDGLRRVVGFVDGKSMPALLDASELSANPRSAKTGSVTTEIIRSLEQDPELFPFKTKGLLIGSSSYRALERQRYEVAFRDPELEGILDGGHNALAIGIYLLELAGVEDRIIRSIRTWTDFKEIWLKHRDDVTECQEQIEFLVPVELLVPADPSDEDGIADFTSHLLEICSARNNNVQLTEEAKANQMGFYASLQEALPEDLSSRVEWKTNDGGKIKVRDILALAWIVFPKLSETKGINVLPNQIYRNKAICVEQFNRVMELKTVSRQRDGYKREVFNPKILKAFSLVAEIPELFDLIYELFPEAYNKAGGAFGKISAVKMYDPDKTDEKGAEKRSRYLKRQPKTPFYERPCSYTCPDGFIMPLVFGLSALIEETASGVKWTKDPEKFLRKNLTDIMRTYRFFMETAQWDPQKVGKNLSVYQFMAVEFSRH
ncbi:MAG: hypothetical protein Q7T44_06130 [Parvibaculum sp.]|nr:hypothetical protein [Parvibaculum sp.]